MSPRAAAAPVAAVIFLLLAVTALAATIHVPGDQPTIQAGIDAASAADTVLVACGTYTENGITLRSGVVLRSETGQADCVTIQPGTNGRVIFASHLAASTVLEGFTITGGRAASGAGLLCNQTSLTVLGCVFSGNAATDFGGGVTCESSSPFFVDCTFSDNSAGIDGGGMACYYGSSPIVTRSRFSGNSANWGGGLLCWSNCLPSISDCTFIDNTAYAAGGGMASYLHSSPSVIRCVFYRNSAGEAGGGLNVWSSSTAAVTNCTFVANSAGLGWGAGVACAEFSFPTLANTIIAFSTQGEAISCDETSGATLSCSDVVGNAGGDWVNCIATQGGVNGNHSVDPLFCDPGQEDFRLQWGSPCLPAHSGGCGKIGVFGAGACPSLSVTPSSWARIKARYR